MYAANLISMSLSRKIFTENFQSAFQNSTLKLLGLISPKQRRQKSQARMSLLAKETYELEFRAVESSSENITAGGIGCAPFIHYA